jgi:hypothetical protein
MRAAGRKLDVQRLLKVDGATIGDVFAELKITLSFPESAVASSVPSRCSRRVL